MEILKEIDIPSIAFKTTGGNNYTNDLTQEIYLELLQKPERVKELHEEGGLKGYVCRMAYYSYHGHLGRFFLKYRRRLELTPEQGTDLNLKEVLDNAELTEIERMWVDEYLKHDCISSWMMKNTDISRQHIAKRIKEIANKCKKSL